MSQFGCVGNTIRLRSGRYFDLADPKPDQFTLADIAGALAKLCRYGGHVPRFYSVAEHCWHCARQAKADGHAEDIQRTALLHDAAEAFIGDVVKPLKIMLSEYPAIEQRIEFVIAAKYGMAVRFPWDAVEEIDRAMLIAEKRGMYPGDPVKWTDEDKVRRLNAELHHWEPDTAERMFLASAHRLGLGADA